MKSITSKKEVLSGDDLQRIYSTRFKGQDAYRNKVWNVLIRDYFQRLVRPSDVVLDLGAGYGQFINNITSGKKYAMDLNPDTVHRVGPEVVVLAQDCSARWPLADESLDVVFTSNFFEHLPNKQALSRTLAEAKRCLKPGGRLIALGPNIKYLPGVYWDFLDHHVPLTEHSLSEALIHEGLSIETCIDKFLPFTMVNGPEYPVFFIAIYLRLPLAWRILGKQFLVIGRKDSL
jgi:SAM-dependent methyltransferase